MAPQLAWTFLTNHAQVLVCIGRNPDILLKDVATQMGVTERAVQRMMADLVNDGYIVRMRVGRQNRYQIRFDQPLPHPIESVVSLPLALQLFGVNPPIPDGNDSKPGD